MPGDRLDPAHPDPDSAARHPFATSGELEAAALRLAQLAIGAEGDAWQAFTVAAHDVVRTLRIGRFGVWFFTEDRSALRCLLLVQPSAGEEFDGSVLRRRDFPSYFAALESQRVVCADDALRSPITAELAAAYLEPLHIGSMMDAPIHRQGRVVGAVCHEHLGGVRAWSDDERHFAATVAQTFARLAEEAERPGAQASAGMTQEQFERLERMSVVAQLAAGVAHDYRNVLHTVNVLAELIGEECRDLPSVRELTDEIRAAVRRGEGLTQNLLAFGQDAPSSPVMLDVPTALHGMERLLALSAGPDVQLEFVLAERVGRVLIDPKVLERMLVNLALNARHAMPSGGHLRIVVREQEHARGELHHTTWVAVEVQDSGVGIQPAVLPRLFEPFFTTKGERGTGLGLPIVDQLARKAGGYLRVQSTPGQGATFRILLPRLAPPA